MLPKAHCENCPNLGSLMQNAQNNASQRKLSRAETGNRNSCIEEIASLLGLYQADHTQRARLSALAQETGEIGWLQSHPAGCSRRAHTLSTLEPQGGELR